MPLGYKGMEADVCVAHGTTLYITPFSYSILVPPSSILVLLTISAQLALVFSGFEQEKGVILTGSLEVAVWNAMVCVAEASLELTL